MRQWDERALELPVIDVRRALAAKATAAAAAAADGAGATDGPTAAQREAREYYEQACRDAASALHKYGVLVVRDEVRRRWAPAWQVSQRNPMPSGTCVGR